MRENALQFVKKSDGEVRWNSSSNKYKAVEVWRVIRPKKEKVNWHKLVWAGFIVPKHAFITWMAVLNRLSTKDKMRAWGMKVDGNCILCRSAVETRDHLFYGCAFLKQVWKEVLNLSTYSRELSDWDEELQWTIQRTKGKNLKAIILKIAWNAAIYFIWTERNRRIYQDKERTRMQVMEMIKEVIRIQLIGLKNVKLDSINFSLYRVWNLQIPVFE